MNRRGFIKTISGFLVSMPFLSWNINTNLQEGGIISERELLIGIDKAILESDQTISFLRIDDYAKAAGITIWPINCRCSLERTKKNESIY